MIAETPMQVLRLFRRTLMALIKDEPQVSLKLLDGITRRVRQVDRLQSSLATLGSAAASTSASVASSSFTSPASAFART